MAPLTETLDRIAQSHIEGRVRPVVPSRSTSHHRCVHCGAEYEPAAGRYRHAAECPCTTFWSE